MPCILSAGRCPPVRANAGAIAGSPPPKCRLMEALTVAADARVPVTAGIRISALEVVPWVFVPRGEGAGIEMAGP